MNPKLLDIVELLEDLTELGLHAGALGTVVVVFSEPEEAYEIEFCDDLGRTVAQLALRPSQFRVVQ